MTGTATLERTSERVATIWLDNQIHYNALSDVMMDGIIEAIESLEGAAACRAIVIRGRGGVFCAGRELRDVQALQQSDVAHVNERYVRMRRLNELMHHSPLPIVSAIEKYAFGGGMMLASWSDIAIAEKSAVLGYPEVFNGITPWAAIPVLVHGISRKAAMDMVLTGRHVPAEEGLRMGLISRVVEDGALQAEIDTVLEGIFRGSPVAVAKTRAFFWDCEDLSYLQGMRVSVEKGVTNIRAPELMEGIAAFLEKRRPVWPE